MKDSNSLQLFKNIATNIIIFPIEILVLFFFDSFISQQLYRKISRVTNAITACISIFISPPLSLSPHPSIHKTGKLFR
jgi:hypothetical protein